MKSEIVEMAPSELRSKVHMAINMLLKNDSFLLINDTNERSISHKLGEYLQHEFPGWNVDCEYNRIRGSDIKKIEDWKIRFINEELNPEDTNAKTVYPDIIIHQRNNKNNLLVIEIKKSTNRDEGKLDIEKIKMFMEDNRGLNYKYGLFINFEVKRRCGIKTLKWFPNEKFGADKYE
ncbi:MAG: hypothetical protein NKF70_08405 [Methanobacterium sp. ERen5]|nr:MAG: hypothetical protein NKF70_08405 [Methanobacterium sp. ERen5]